MENRVSQIAARVIAAAGANLPADAALRTELRTQQDLSQAQSERIAHAVFSYYRWMRWLSPRETPVQRVEHAADLARQFADDPSVIPDAALRSNAVPDWIHSAMETPIEWLRALQAEPSLWIRARADRTASLMQVLRDCFPVNTLPAALSYDGPLDLFRTPEFHAGEFELQDIASQAVGHFCAPQPRETWWDACAGEGGKMLHLSDLMGNTGLIWATDRALWRLKQLKRRAARAKAFNYRSVLWNGSKKLPTKTRFDGVLVDAPCSGVGTWQRNPHARWTTSPADVGELGQAQLTLLSHVAPLVKPGGRLVYSVCTLTTKETGDVTREFQKNFPEFEPFPAANPFIPAAAPSALQWWWPHQTGGGGMFVASWRRTG